MFQEDTDCLTSFLCCSPFVASGSGSNLGPAVHPATVHRRGIHIQESKPPPPPRPILFQGQSGSGIHTAAPVLLAGTKSPLYLATCSVLKLSYMFIPVMVVHTQDDQLMMRDLW